METSPDMAQPSKQDIEYIINHVVLLPRLPQKAEDSKIVAAAEQALLSLVLSTAYRFCQQCPSEFKSIWQVVTGMLSRWINLQPHGPLFKTALVSAILEMKSGDVLPIHIRAQNAALIFRRHETQMITECFELSPRAEDVLGCKGNLRRSFPAHGVAIPVEVYTIPAFHDYLCDKIIELDSETVDETMPKSRKAGSDWSEIRDTCHPELVTEWLMTTLAAIGSPYKVIKIQKRTRDDVLWDRCLLPWRRSAFWLLTRVAIQTTLATSLKPDASLYQYKSFMIYHFITVLGHAFNLGVGGDVCQVIQMKIARRTAQLNHVYPFVLDAAQRAVKDAAQAQLECWGKAQEHDADRRTTVNLSTLKQDTNLTLRNARPVLNAALQGFNQVHLPETQLPSVTHEWLENTDSNVPIVNSSLCSRSERTYALAAFERWVWQTLPVWLEHALGQPDPTACTAIAHSASTYSVVALELYEECPEQLSLMLLVLGELWRALDIMAGTIIPLLLQYPPEVPNKIFQPLLLPKSCQMRRLQKLELYIDMRHRNVEPGSTGSFDNPEHGDFDCFASRFFEISSSHQELRRMIIKDADNKWDAKKTEWRQKTLLRKTLKEEAESIESCTMYLNMYGLEEHDHGCRKCQLNEQVQQLAIDVFEWPLPEDEVHCRVAVVELHCPEVITAWRNLTWMIVNDLGRLPRNGECPKDTLHSYSGLRGYYTNSKSRLILGSTTKSVTVSHYRRHGLPVELEDLRSDHALQWKFYDSQESCWVEDQTDKPCFSRMCQVSLPEGPYKNLEDTVNSTSHTQNRVLATQIDCSAQLSPHEYIAFGSLRADGERTQWFKICHELEAPNLTWNTPSVCCLIQQTAWHSGPSASSFLRLLHDVFEITELRATLLSNLSCLLDSIRANGKCLYTMNIIIILAARILSLGTSGTAANATGLLQRCRSIIRDWTSGLQTSLRATTAARQIKNTQRSLLRAGLLAKSTFDIDERYLAQSMVTTEDVESWTTNSIIVHDNTPEAEDELPVDLRRLLVQDRKFSHTIHGRVQNLLAHKPKNGLDNAVLQIWSSFRSSGSRWKRLKRPHERWIRKMTVSDLDDRSQAVCYNVLDGGLLINGSPLGTLPHEYTAHAVFVRVFGDQILHVVTSDMTGMVYMTAAEEDGCIFHFVLRQSRLIIRAKTSSKIYELIPHTAFEGDLPTKLVHDHNHWLNIELSEVDFRPLSRDWAKESWRWRLVYRPYAESQLYSKDAIMIDAQSQTSQEIVAVLGGLEKLEFMHITRSFDDRVQIELPRSGLRFFINNDNELECQELQKVVDPDQSTGALIGLRNRLVLCAIGPRSRKIDRTILIPQGLVSVAREREHIKVEITLEGAHVQYMRYQHNGILNRLDGDGSFMSRVYQAYLHALTTHILPDPLTGLTGTEQSLKLLEEQALKCCIPFKPAEIDLLNLIARLTPQRTFYPAHLQVMQQVSWHAILTPLAQHEGFVVVADRILTRSHKFSLFYSTQETLQTLQSSSSLDLSERAGLRSSAYRNPDHGGNKSSVDHDKTYKARDTEVQPKRAARVYEMSKYVIDWPERIHVASKLEDRWLEWGTVSGFRDAPKPSFSVSELLKIEFAPAWAPIYKICRQATRHSSQYQILFLFSQIAHGSGINSLDDLKILLAFATNSTLKDLSPFPDYRSFALSKGTFPHKSQVRLLVSDCKEPFAPSRLYLGPARRRQEKGEYLTTSSANIDDAVSQFMAQWPCTRLSPIPSSRSKWLSVQAATSAVQHYFEECCKNQECQEHLVKIQSTFAETASDPVPKFDQALWHQAEWVPRSYRTKQIPTLQSLVNSREPSVSTPPSLLHIQQDRAEAPDMRRLRLLIDDFGARSNATQSAVRTQYETDLLGSLDAYGTQSETVVPDTISDSLHQQAVSALKKCETHFLEASDLLSKVLGPNSLIERLLDVSGLWPRCQMPDMLREIRSRSCANLPQRWKTGIVNLGLSISILQRSRRMILAVEKRDIPGFCREAENPGRVYWEAGERPDWLLLEIENDLLIRPIQARVALEMIAHSTNHVTQLNMGEGKSSVVVPMIAIALADGSQLARILVLRSLTRQMQDTLNQRLGGLVGRPIYFMPFSRKTNIEPSVIQRIRTMYHECMTSGGVLLVQPEHVLSFKLMGIERFASDPSTIGAQLLQTQVWLDEYCRNILDESDEILDVKFQLIYTLGSQRSMDGQPDRWVMVQAIFDLVQRRAHLLQLSHPKQIDVEQTGAEFPVIRLLSLEVRRLLISGVLEDVCNSKLPGLVMSTLPMEIRQAVDALVGQYNITDEACGIIKTFFAEDEGYLKKLLLVRGLIAHGILMLVLCTQRWSVTYGLDPRRCMCAVPYRAKGVPALTAEFGHPDVMIALTCLSYYYGGLTDLQLQICLDFVQKVDDPRLEYETWVAADPSFPHILHHWTAVNLEDRQQCDNLLFPALRKNKRTVDFFLTHVVFPKEGKEFDQKLSASGWDIPAIPGSSKVTTGFSGTNDNRFLLPSSICQSDLPELQHTSGKVLEILSRSENLSYHCATDETGSQLSSNALLHYIHRVDPSVRILIDVGAQILDLSNEQVATQWLTIVTDAEAGVYFDEGDYAMIITRNGKREKLANSAYAQQTDRCIVYLDDAHTRGTDLKLPRTARAAVTLGPRLTKDRLAQACMRLRQLGQGQTLMFFAPPEVHHDIAKISSTKQTARLDGLNVIAWCLEESYQHIQDSQPLRVLQGLNFHRRRDAMTKLIQSLPSIKDSMGLEVRENHRRSLVEHESQSLRDLYAPAQWRGVGDADVVSISRKSSDKNIQDLIGIWDQIGIQALQSATMHEEHEREVSCEVEQETQIERPPMATPLNPMMDSGLPKLIRKGTSSAFTKFLSAYTGILRHSSSAYLVKCQSEPWSRLRVSKDFINTIKQYSRSSSNDYFRPVNWILVSKDTRNDNALLISQYEVNQIFDDIRAPTSQVTLISYEPRVTRSMPSLDSTTQASFPLPGAQEAWMRLSNTLREELHLFAGQLYFADFAAYGDFTKRLEEEEGAVPLAFIRHWMGIRRKGGNYLQTHIGQVVSGRLLEEATFEMEDEAARTAG